MLFICGYYEGYDECICEYLVIDEIFIGDFVLMGGEFFVMMIVDSVVRLFLGVLGKEVFYIEDLFSIGFLEYLYYIRLVDYKGLKVFEIFLLGNYVKIKEWWNKELIRRIYVRCLDFLKDYLFIE